MSSAPPAVFAVRIRFTAQLFFLPSVGLCFTRSQESRDLLSLLDLQGILARQLQLFQNQYSVPKPDYYPITNRLLTKHLAKKHERQARPPDTYRQLCSGPLGRPQR